MDFSFDWLFVVTFLLAFVTSIISGIGGGGGGFIMMPYFLFIGLPPATALATAKFGGVGTAVGALTAFKGKGLINKKLLVPLMTITFAMALLAIWIVPQINPTMFENAIGVILLLMVPTLFIKKASLQPGPRSVKLLSVGYVAFAFFSFLQALAGTGIGTLVVLVLMFLFGLTALEANATKRVVQSVQAILVLFLLGIQGFVALGHGIGSFAGSILGSHVGAHIAIKKGSDFVKVMMAGVMVVSGLVLIIW